MQTYKEKVMGVIEEMIKETDRYWTTTDRKHDMRKAIEISLLEKVLSRINEIQEDSGWIDTEKGAEIMHDIWSKWFYHQLTNSTADNIQRWTRQANTPYSELSEEDKEKDRKQFRKLLSPPPTPNQE